MVPHHDFTPHGYLDNPYHSWKLNPSGVLRSLPPLGMGWHVPNLGSYVRNQFHYTAHLALGLKIGKRVLITPEDFKRHNCLIESRLHTKNRFEYTCVIPKYEVTLTIRYFLVAEHALGCVLSLQSSAPHAQPITGYLIHHHVHNPFTSRLWEHGWYSLKEAENPYAMLGLASEGDVFVHGVRAADGGPLEIGAIGYTVSLEDMAHWAAGEHVERPSITQRQEDSGLQIRTVALPFTLTLDGKQERIINAVLARGVSRDLAIRQWEDGIEEIALADAQHRADDEQFWEQAPQLTGDWPKQWKRGFVYDFETLRMTMRLPTGLIPHVWDGMQVQAPRTVLAEAAMDTLFLSYADPELAAEVILGHFESAPHANLPCMREDGSYNMVADDGQVCGTAPEWGFPIWCCDQLWRRNGDIHWLRRLYPRAAAYLRWWLDHRRDVEGWLVYACSWESGQDVSSRFGPQQTGGTIIQQVRPVDLQASMAQGAEILVRWSAILAQQPAEQRPETSSLIDYAAESTYWRTIADEFTVKTRLMWQDGWFRDYDSVAREWSTEQDAMHLAPVFCGVAGWGHTEQLRPFLAQPPKHSAGWAPLSWPPVVMTLVGAAAAAQMEQDAAELASRFIDASYRSMDQRELDEHGGLPGVTREYRQPVTKGKWGEIDYVNAGIEGYGWGALSVHLLVHYLLGMRAEVPDTLTIAPMLPAALRQVGATYRIAPLPWGSYTLELECQVRDTQGYTIQVRCRSRSRVHTPELFEVAEPEQPPSVQECTWEGAWGEGRTLHLPMHTSDSQLC